MDKRHYLMFLLSGIEKSACFDYLSTLLYFTLLYFTLLYFTLLYLADRNAETQILFLYFLISLPYSFDSRGHTIVN